MVGTIIDNKLLINRQDGKGRDERERGELRIARETVRRKRRERKKKKKKVREKSKDRKEEKKKKDETGAMDGREPE